MVTIWFLSSAKMHVVVRSRPVLRIALAVVFVVAVYMMITGIHTLIISQQLQQQTAFNSLSSTSVDAETHALNLINSALEAAKPFYLDFAGSQVMPFRDG